MHRTIAHNPRVEEKTVDGYLRALKIVVQRQHIRDALHSVDPLASQRRLCRALNHREYHVEHPNALLHVDGYHKLICWGIVIHGGNNGYSRLVTYLLVATNNQAETAFRAFQTGVKEYGVPSRVRTDKGGENVQIAEFMIMRRGSNRGSIITGRSLHNQRIEQLWRNVFTDCISFLFIFCFLLYEVNSCIGSICMTPGIYM